MTTGHQQLNKAMQQDKLTAANDWNIHITEVYGQEEKVGDNTGHAKE
jgi:hypothetical protein